MAAPSALSLGKKMASAHEQLASNFSFGALMRATELQQRILFTLGILIAYRLGTFIPIPGIDAAQFQAAFNTQAQGLLGVFNMFSGGAVERMAVFALNVMPYISASIIVQLMTTVIPQWEKLKKDGEAGRKELNQYTRYLTVALALAQASGIAFTMQSQEGLVSDPGISFVLSTVITLVGGTMLLMWMGEQITARGVGNGISLIIFAGIVAELPNAIGRTLTLAFEGSLSFLAVIAITVMALGLVGFIVFMERSLRRLRVQYPKRQQGNRMSQPESSFLPLKLNPSGVLPPIFASTFLLLPATITPLLANRPTTDGSWQSSVIDGLAAVAAALGHGQPLYMLMYAGLIIFFSFFYTSIIFNPEETADNLRKYGGFIPGIRPGKKTAEYIDQILTRITVIGAVYLTFVCLLPEVLIANYQIPFYLGGTSLLIVVSVTIDTMTQVQSHLLAHQYEGLIKKSRLRGRTT